MVHARSHGGRQPHSDQRQRQDHGALGRPRQHLHQRPFRATGPQPRHGGQLPQDRSEGAEISRRLPTPPTASDRFLSRLDVRFPNMKHLMKRWPAILLLGMAPEFFLGARLSSLAMAAPAEPDQPTNQLSDEEKKAGWKLLFDGKSTDGWHSFRKE